MKTPTPRTDAATYPADCLGKTLVTNRDCARALETELVTLTAAYTCTHHNDAERTACPVCLVTALTAERDQLRSDCENETKWAAHYLADAIAVKAERDQLRALFPAILAALRNGRNCTTDVSVEFLKCVPNEVASVVSRLRVEVERWQGASATMAQESEHKANEASRLRAEVERFKGWLSDPQALHAHCLRTLNEAQIAHLCGERMTEIVNRAERAEAELADHITALGIANRSADEQMRHKREAEAELTAEREKVRVLREALQNLRDEQNGAPLCTREEQWTQAMDRADAALAATEDAK